MTDKSKRAGLLVFMKSMKSNANLINEMLSEGHLEAASMCQSKFVEQFEEAYEVARELLNPDAEEKVDSQGIRPKKK